jgi:hypothetical protein
LFGPEQGAADSAQEFEASAKYPASISTDRVRLDNGIVINGALLARPGIEHSITGLPRSHRNAGRSPLPATAQPIGESKSEPYYALQRGAIPKLPFSSS